MDILKGNRGSLTKFAYNLPESLCKHAYVDVSDYNGTNYLKCLYVLSGKPKAGVQLLGAWSNGEGKLFAAPKTTFETKGRKFERTPLEALL